MKQWLGFPAAQIVLCIAVYALIGYYLGKLPLVWTAPLFAYAVSRPIIALASSIRWKMWEHLWRQVHGHHYVFRDITIHVLEDNDHCRWVCLADVRKVVGAIASERALAATYPDRLKNMDGSAQMYTRDDELIAHLSKENKPEALRFRTWAQRNIASPGGRIRKRFGINSTI